MVLPEAMKQSMSGQKVPERSGWMLSCFKRVRQFCRLWLAVCSIAGAVSPLVGSYPGAYAQAEVSEQKASHIMYAQEVESTFPPSVFFKGKSAPVQWRNASAVRFADDALLFAGLIDTSGYASSVQETYQMYLLSETATVFGGKVLPAGAYGAGFVGERFIVMDLGGHTVAEGQTQLDKALARPRPLQFLQANALSVRLYLGRRWVSISVASPGDIK